MTEIEPTDMPDLVQAIVPTAVATGGELARLPQTFGDMAEYFRESEASPAEVIRWIMDPGEMEETDPEESARSIVLRILLAQTAEEVLTRTEAVHAQDIIGQTIEAEKVTWQHSDHQQASSCYAVIHGKFMDTGEACVVTCGAKNVMVALIKLTTLNAYPIKVRITKSSKPTRAGYYPLWLEMG